MQPSRAKCDGSAERDAGLGSSGFSSFDGHGTCFDMVRGLAVIFLPFFFFCFDLLLALCLLAFSFFFFPKIMCLSTDRIHSSLVKEAL